VRKVAVKAKAPAKAKPIGKDSVPLLQDEFEALILRSQTASEGRTEGEACTKACACEGETCSREGCTKTRTSKGGAEARYAFPRVFRAHRRILINIDTHSREAREAWCVLFLVSLSMSNFFYQCAAQLRSRPRKRPSSLVRAVIPTVRISGLTIAAQSRSRP
jgi:hypothetical protein